MMSAVSVESLLVLLVGVGALVPLFARGRPGWRAGLAVLFLGAAAGLAWSGRAPPAGSEGDPGTSARPIERRGDGFLSSKSCQACHPSQHASWSASYHRTMTQVVTPATMAAVWDGAELEWDGQSYTLEQTGDQFWIENPDGTRSRALVSTGSHHQQVYWAAVDRGREIRLLPFTWLIAEQRWIPYDQSFLGPFDFTPPEVWNTKCIRCHSTAYSAGQEPLTGVLDTEVGEFGIACEACHGPGEEHVRANRDPLRRIRQRFSDDGDETIVHPGKVDAARSAEICGQCHSLFTPRDESLAGSPASDGRRYLAGAELDEVNLVIRRPRDPGHPLFSRPGMRERIDSCFWQDGMIRMAGRDYNAMLDTPCFEGGTFSCLSCHSMHESDPVDQLARGMDGDEACLQCHQELRADIQAHTHHRPESSGSRCYDCHMPYTSWGLLKTVRSHTVSNPNVAESLEPTGRPNACNLCHLDRTLAWTGEHLEEWYGADQADVPEGELSERSAAVLWLMRGDAGQRALIVAGMGRASAREASGSDWLAPFLAVGLTDEYAAVRFVAARSFSGLSGFEDFAYDYLAPQEERLRAAAEAMELWQGARSPGKSAPRAEVFLGADGGLENDALKRLREERSRRRIIISE